MSYKTWNTYGYGFCVDDINTTPEKLLQLAAMKPEVLKEVQDYLNAIYPDGYKVENLTMADFDDLEGEYCEHGLAYVLFHVIDGIWVEYVDDYGGVPYILYTPTYPWRMDDNDMNLSERDVEDTFRSYISILTHEHIVIDYYSVENGC